jgi:hypothetical protein
VTDIARLSFGHEDQPEEQGVLVLSDDGTVRVEPSDSLRDALAAQAERYGTRLGLGLIGLGFVAVGLGWYAGRFYGKYAWRRTAPRSVKSVEITQEQAQMRVRLGSAVWDIWNYDPADAEIFVTALKDLNHEN